MPTPTSFWLILAASAWLQTINGPNADFPVYSSQLKQVKGISQVQINFLGSASDAGKLFGWIAGVAALYVPLWAVAFVGAASVLVGYGVQFLFLERRRLAYWHLFALTSLAGNGICWINTVCYLPFVNNNFPSDSRVAVSLATSYVGLSAKLYTNMAETLQGGLGYSKAKMYLLLNAVVPMVVALVVVPVLVAVPSLQAAGSTTGSACRRTDAGFLTVFFITLATGACALVDGVVSKSLWLTISLYVMLAVPMLIAVALMVREISLAKSRENRVDDLELSSDESVVMELASKEEKEQGVELEHGHAGRQGEEVGGLRLLCRSDFWLYFFSYMFSVTLGLVFLNNLGQIAESRGLSDPSTLTLVSLSSSFGFFGRLLPAFLDYYTAKSGYSISRTAFMAWLMAPIAGAFFLLLHPLDMLLYMSTAVIGTCTGAITSVAVSATSELFGTRNFSVNHSVLVANIPVGSLCFGYLAAVLYQREARGSSNRCDGAACYRNTFLLWGITCAVGTGLCAALYARSGVNRHLSSAHVDINNKGQDVVSGAGSTMV
uniref:Uncharacterized protein n=1 Tax=Avena sativa TaxID=4498 RepID=A0ACD5XXF9_AVESA